MGDVYYLKLKCAYCKRMNPKKDKTNQYLQEDYVYYAENCGVTTFKCDFCNKVNKITQEFKTKKI